MSFVLRCPDCRGKFKWKGDKFPDDCPLCKAHIGHDRDDDDVVMPWVSKPRANAFDKTLRQIADGSEQRAEAAAQLGGGTAADYSALKITNLNDRRDAEIVAMPVNNAVTQHMAATGQGGFVGGDGSGYSGAVQTGPAPNAGAKMRTSIQAHHAQLSHGSAVSDRPANEVTQPGYRRRG